MTKAEIVREIASSTGLDKASVLETVEKFMDTVKDSLANGENVYLRGFGSFIVKTRSQKTARNISKNTVIIILTFTDMPNGKKRKGHKMATHKRKKRLRKNRHKNKK